MKQELLSYLKNWDPLGYGVGSYETEVKDVVQAAYELNDTRQLARRIQFIYQFSFKQMIPFHECKRVAREILTIKKSSDCA